MSDPFREQRFDPKEVRRILRVASALADADPETASSGRALTRAEIEQSASELGLPASSIARAMSGGEGEPAPEQLPAKPSRFIGAPTRIVFEEEVEGEPTETDREDLLEEIRTVLGETGSVETVGKTMIWKLTPVQGRGGRELSVRLRTREGRTKIVVEERLVRQATGLFLGLGVGGGIGPMGGYIAAMINLGLVGAVFPLLWIPIMLLLARTIFVGLAKRREESLQLVMNRILKLSKAWAPSGKERVRVSKEKAADTEALAEAEAEAEEEQGARLEHR